MTKKEKINRKIELSFAFAKAIVADPSILDKIPNGATIEFVEESDIEFKKKVSQSKNKRQKKRYIKVKPTFEIL